MSLALSDWRIILTDLNSVPLAEISDEAIEPGHTEVLNGIDRMEFTLNLESQAAYIAQPIKTLVKMWRDVPGQTPFPDGLPMFCGVITGRTRNAAQRTATYTAHSPFWRLTLRYHIDSHDWSASTGRGSRIYRPPPNQTLFNEGSDPTDIMWQMIDWTNQVVQYSQGDRTGIRVFSPAAKADYFGADPAVLYDARYPVGQNTWDLVQDMVMRAGFPDLSPTYIHVEGSPELVWFNTVLYKGTTQSTSFDYRTGAKNLDDVVETAQMESGEYANYVVIQGAGDKSTGWYDPGTGQSGSDQTIVRADGTSTASLELGLPDLISADGLYMHYEQDNLATNNDMRYKMGKHILRRLAKPPASYEVTLTKAQTHAWPYTFRAGDTVTLNCDRDSMQFSDVPVRITEVTVRRTQNKMENVSVTLVDPDSYKVYEF